MLDWSQENLATHSGLSVNTIRKLELGQISPRGKTMTVIRRAFENVGIEFLEPNGVRQRSEEIMVYQGHDGAVSFFNDVYETTHRKGGEIILVCKSELPFVEALGGYDKIYIEKMTAIKDRMTMKCLLTEDDKCLPCTNYSEYKFLSKGYVDSVPFYVYDDKYAIFVFDIEPSPKITVIKSLSIAQAFRRQFYSMWDKATPLSAAAQPIARVKKRA